MKISDMSNLDLSEPWHGTVTDNPDLYDQYHDNYIEDLPFYLNACKGREDILECGAGTGRLSIPLAQAGHEITALDNSKSMLKTLKQKIKGESSLVADNIKVVLGDMVNFEFERKFSCIIVPFMTFNYLPTTEAQIGAFNSFAKHLRPGGLLIIDAMSMHPKWVSNSSKPVTVSRKKLPGGNLVEIDRHISGDLPMQVVEQQRYYNTRNADGSILETRHISWRNRIVSLGEIRLLHYISNLKLVDILGGYKDEKYCSDSLNCLTIATLEA